MASADLLGEELKSQVLAGEALDVFEELLREQGNVGLLRAANNPGRFAVNVLATTAK